MMRTTFADRVETETGIARPPARILLVTHGYPPHQSGGAELQAQRKAHWWAKRGDTVRVLTADPRSDGPPPFGVVEHSDEQDGSVSIHRLRFQAPDGTQPFEDTFQHPLLAEEIRRELESFQPDLVYQVSGYLFGVAPLQLAATHGIPSVLFAMDFWHTCPRLTLLRPDGVICDGPRQPADCAACRFTDRPSIQRFPAVARATWSMLATAGRWPAVAGQLEVAIFTERLNAIRSALATVSMVVVNSQFLAGQLRLLGVPDDRILIVRQGLDVGQHRIVKPDRQPNQPLRVLYLGQIAHHKGVDLAVRAVRDLVSQGYRITLDIHGQPTGDPDYRAELARLSASPEIELGEPLGREALMLALRRSDVLVVPSRWYENSPNVILEAFATGTPVVVAGHGGMAEMVRDGIDGLHFTPGDVSSLTDALRSLAADHALLGRLSAGITTPTSVSTEMALEEAALAGLLHQRV